jgi:hypothetical protein
VPDEHSLGLSQVVKYMSRSNRWLYPAGGGETSEGRLSGLDHWIPSRATNYMNRVGKGGKRKDTPLPRIARTTRRLSLCHVISGRFLLVRLYIAPSLR